MLQLVAYVKFKCHAKIKKPWNQEWQVWQYCYESTPCTRRNSKCGPFEPHWGEGGNVIANLLLAWLGLDFLLMPTIFLSNFSRMPSSATKTIALLPFLLFTLFLWSSSEKLSCHLKHEVSSLKKMKHLAI